MAEPRYVIPLRTQPNAPDDRDAERIQLVTGRWHGLDQAYLERDRAVEEAIRMVLGRQWDVWSDLLGKFVDVSQVLSDEERQWRQRPSINRLQYWFILTHARMTENPPIISFQPSSADRMDALLAEVMDPIFKTLCREVGLTSAIDLLAAWLIPGGEAFLKSRVDYAKGPMQELVGPAMLSMDTEDGPIQRLIESAAFDQSGNPMGGLVPDEETGDFGYSFEGQPHSQREGQLILDVLGPLEVRGQAGNTIPWERKRWHIQRWFLTPDEVEERYGVRVQPDFNGSLDGGAGYLERLMFGSGYFGAVSNRDAGLSSGPQKPQSKDDGFVAGYEMWEAPIAGTDTEERDGESPGGRLICCTKTTVLHDSVRPYPLKYVSPIRRFQMLNIPGRPAGSSPIEMQIPLQKSFNRVAAQLMEHANLMGNPKILTEDGVDLDGEITNAPGEVIEGGMRNGLPVVSYLAPPQPSASAWKTLDFLSKMLDVLGNIEGAEGGAPTEDSSGELVKELRFNSDRFIGPTLRRMVDELARMAEDWIAILSVTWTQEKLITYAGEDNQLAVVQIQPEMFEGKVNVFPDPESMLPEGRGERQARIQALYQMGAFGDPVMDPNARKTFLELARFPHLGRAGKVGGVDRATAERNIAKIIRGERGAAETPILPQHNLGVFLLTLRDVIAAPEYDSYEQPVQQELQVYFQMLQLANVQAQIQQMALAAPVATAQADMQGAVAQRQIDAAPEELRPQPPEAPASEKPKQPKKASA